MRSRTAAVAVLLACALAAGACGSATTPETPTTSPSQSQTPATSPSPQQTPAGSNVFVIVLENREFGQVIGNPDVPYFNRLARRGALMTRYFAITHPSLPNYLAIVGGSTFGIDSDCTACSAHGSNLALQLDEAGISWRAYMDDMPMACFTGASAASYAKKHNPFAYFPSITRDQARCSNVVPGSQLRADLRGDGLAAFSWLTPNLCNDAHDCGMVSADRYLQRVVPKLLPHLGPQGFLVLTFDEGLTDRGCCGVAHGGRIATVLVGPAVRKGLRLGRALDHYSLLRTLEDAFSLPHLRGAAGARPLRAAFRRFPSLAR